MRTSMEVSGPLPALVLCAFLLLCSGCSAPRPVAPSTGEPPLTPSTEAAAQPPLQVRSKEGDVRLVSLQHPWYVCIPGPYEMTAEISQPDGRLLNTQKFSAGWRAYVYGIAVRRHPTANYDLIELTIYSIMTDKKSGKRLYELTHDALVDVTDSLTAQTQSTQEPRS